MQESQKGRYNLEQIREPEDEPLIQGMLQARDELESPGKKEKRCFHSGNMRKKTGLKMPKSGCRRDAGV